MKNETGKHSVECDQRSARFDSDWLSGEYCEFRCGNCVDPTIKCGEQTCGCSHRCGAEGYYENGRPMVCTEDRCAIWS